MRAIYILDGLDCANCAAKIEKAVAKIPGVDHATVNFMSTKMTLEAEATKMPEIVEKATRLIGDLEPDVKVLSEAEAKGQSVHHQECSCGHDHEHDHSHEGHTHSHAEEHQHGHTHGEGQEKGRLGRIIISGVLLVILMVASPDNQWLRLGLYLIVYGLVGGDVLIKAVKNIIHGQVFDENFLMGVATIGAFGLGEYFEAVMVMLLYQIGEYFQDYAVGQSRKSISSLMEIRPDAATLLVDGAEKVVSPESIAIGDLIVVKPGERVPLDGEVIEGSSMVDTSALTGESVPRKVDVGETLLSGCINQSGVLKVKVTKVFGESTVAKILDLVENASNKKSKSENFITKFSRIYTPTVVILAVVLAVVPPLVIPGAVFSDYIRRALTFLVISCPCALVISVPLSFFGGIGGASKLGILIKGSNYMETLAKADTVVFDKTGTLTKGVFKVQKVAPVDMSSDELLQLAAYVESYSTHPISLSLQKAYGKPIEKSLVTDVKEIAGHGVEGRVSGQVVSAGNHKLMIQLGLNVPEMNEVGTIVYVAVDGVYRGAILISDELKADAKEAMKQLHNYGIKKTVMLTGDNQQVGEKVAKDLGMSQVFTNLLPGDKVAKVEDLLENESDSGKLAFVGDGINDAPVLARADIGIAMGGLGSDAAIEAADVVIMDDKPSKIATAIHIAKRTIAIVKQNIVFALGIKILFLILGAFDIVHIGGAIFADVGVTIIAVLNAMRCLQVKQYKD